MIDEVLHYHTAPGSTEMYLIPSNLLDQYVHWCTQCDLFDEPWQQMKDYFAPYEIIYKNRSEHNASMLHTNDY